MTCTSRPIVTRPPAHRRDESPAAYRSRVAEWQRDRLEANGRGHRQLTLLAGLSVLGTALVAKVAGLSYARGPVYHPIALSERIVAALLRLDGTRANHQARAILDELLDLGVLVLVKEPRGRRPGQYRLDVALYVTSRRRAPEQKGHNRPLRPLSTGTSSGARSPKKKQEKRETEGQPSAPPAPASSQGAESGGAPPGSTTDERPMSLSAWLASLPDDERERQEQERAEPEAARKAEHEAFERALQALSLSEVEAIRDDARRQVARLGIGVDGAAYRGLVQAALLRRAVPPQRREVCHVG